MGCLFTLSTAGVLGNYRRKNEARRLDAPTWGMVAWDGFALALVLTGWGLKRKAVNPAGHRGLR